MTRTTRLLALAPIAAFFLGCHIEEPFARDNHWDEGGTSTKTLTGPESTFSVGDTFSVTLTGDPPLPPGELTVTWESNGLENPDVQVFAAGYGKFTVRKAEAEYIQLAVSAHFGRNIVAHTIWVGQRLALFDLFCGTNAARVACDATPLAVGQNRTVNSTMFDARNNALVRREGLMRRATIVVRDPTIASVPQQVNANGAWLMFGTAPGSTWIVISADGVRDSVRLLVGP